MKKITQIIFLLIVIYSNTVFTNNEQSWFDKGTAFSVLNDNQIINCYYFAGGNSKVRALDLTFQFLNPYTYEKTKTINIKFFKKLESLNIPTESFQVTKNEIVNILPKGKFIGNDLVFFIKNKIFKLSFKEDKTSSLKLLHTSDNLIYDIHINKDKIYNIHSKGVSLISKNKNIIKWPKQNWPVHKFNVKFNHNQLGVLSISGLNKGNKVNKSYIFNLDENHNLKTFNHQNIITPLNDNLILSYLNDTKNSGIKIENIKTLKTISKNTSTFINNNISKVVVCDNRFIALEIENKTFVVDIISGEIKQTISFDKKNTLTGFIYPKLYFNEENISLENLFNIEIDTYAPKLFVNGLSKNNINTTSDSFVTIEGRFVDDNDIKSITINDKNIKFNATKGTFNFTTDLDNGENEFIISATDTFNNTHSEKIIILREEIVALSRGSTKEETSTVKNISDFNYKALLISNATYLKDIINLDFPIIDAENLSNVLLNNYTFEKKDIIHLKDATRSDIINTLDSLANSITSKDNLLIFYAGHGVYDETLKKGYWVPVDADIDKKDNWVSNSDIKDYIAAFKSQHTLLISDACFSGSIFDYKQRNLNNTDQIVTEKLLNKKSRKAMTSGLNKTVPDKSIFVKYLIKNLKENNKPYLRTGELYNDIREAVMANTINNPQFEVIKNANHEGGEFIFLKRE